MSDVRKDLQEIRAFKANMEEQIHMLEAMTDTYIRDMLHVSLDCKKTIGNLTMAADDEEAYKALTERDIADLFTADDIKAIEEGWKTETENYPDLVDYKRSIVKKIRSSILDYEKLKAEKEQLDKDVDSITSNYFEYINSDEYRAKQKEKIEQMRRDAENESDPVVKKKILDKLSAVEKANNWMFLYDHINEVGEKELANIVDVFFNDSRSRMVMKKFESRLPRYGYNPKIYKMYFNLEENFLPEEYHVFNNFFLFNIMRFISFTSTDVQTDTLFVSSILLALYKLNYHKFNTSEQEKEFVSFIKNYLDMFMPFTERFKKDNVLAPGHPYRVAKDKEYEQQRRILTIAKLQDHGVEPDTTLDTEVLMQQLKDVVAKENGEVVEEKAEENKDENPNDKLPNVNYPKEEIKEDEVDKILDKNPEEMTKEEKEKIVETYVGNVEKTKKGFETRLNYKGKVEFFDRLPKDPEVGDTYTVLYTYEKDDPNKTMDLNKEYAWVGDKWDCIQEIYQPAVEDAINAIESSAELEPFETEAEAIGKELMDHINTEINKEVASYPGMEELLEKVGSSEEVKAFEEEVEKIHDELHGIEGNVGEEVELTSEATEGPAEEVEQVSEPVVMEEEKTSEEVVEKQEVIHYVDRYRCYYKMIGKTYSYFDENGDLIEEGIPEVDILMLNSSGALQKEVVME